MARVKAIRKDTRDLLQAVVDAGAVIVEFRRHIIIDLPNGQRVSCPRTASDWRSIRNTAHDIARHGLRFTFRGKEYGK